MEVKKMTHLLHLEY